MQDEEKRECKDTEEEEQRCFSRTFFLPVCRRFLLTSWMGLNKRKQHFLVGNLMSAMFIQCPVSYLVTLGLKSYLVARFWQDRAVHGFVLLSPLSCGHMYVSVHSVFSREAWQTLASGFLITPPKEKVSKLKDSWPCICDSNLTLLRKSLRWPLPSWRKSDVWTVVIVI